MIKRLRPLLILLGVAVLLGALLWVLIAFVLPKDDDGEDKGNAVVLMETDLTEAEYLSIKNEFDEYKLVKETIDNYYIEGKKGLAVNNSLVEALLTKLGGLTATKKVVASPSEEQLESYGLAEPACSLAVNEAGETYRFEIGNTSSSGNYYARKEGDEAVYLIATDIPDIVLLSRYQFYSEEMIQYTGQTADLEKLTEIIIGGSKRDQELIIRNNVLGDEEVGAAFMLEEPIYHSFSNEMSERINTLLSTLPTCSIVGDDTTPAGLKKYELDQPHYYISFTIDGETQKVYFGKVNDSNSRYCYAEGSPFVHYVDESYCQFFASPLKDYCEDMIYTRAYDQLSGIKISGKGRSYQIDIGKLDEEGEFNVAVNNRSVKSEQFSEFYSHILMIDITDMGEKGENKTPYLTVEFTLHNGTVETMKFYEVSGLKCFCELNGTGLFWVATQNVDRILSNAQALYDGEVIKVEW